MDARIREIQLCKSTSYDFACCLRKCNELITTCEVEDVLLRLGRILIV